MPSRDLAVSARLNEKTAGCRTAITAECRQLQLLDLQILDSAFTVANATILASMILLAALDMASMPLAKLRPRQLRFACTGIVITLSS